MKRGQYITRSVYQQLAEENKKLLGDIRLLTCEKMTAESIICAVKWKDHFEKEAQFNAMMKEYVTNYFKEHPEHDITNANFKL